MAIFAHTAHAFQPVDINAASWEQIALLPSVGKTLAENIVLFRKTHGNFDNAEDLKTVPGMTERKLNDLHQKIIFGEPKKGARKIDTPKIATVQLEHKPIIDLLELEVAALKFHGLSLESDTSLKNRVRKSAWLPKLSFLFDTDHQSLTSEKIDQMKDSRSLRGGRDFGFSINFSFNLDKLIFNKDEIEIAKLLLKRLDEREELKAKLHNHYFRYRHLTAIAKSPLEKSYANALDKEREELALRLDSMSGGAFSHFQNHASFDVAEDKK